MLKTLPAQEKKAGSLTAWDNSVLGGESWILGLGVMVGMGWQVRGSDLAFCLCNKYITAQLSTRQDLTLEPLS